MSYMLDEQFCSLCLEPLHGELHRCPSCGQKTTPLTISERLKADDAFTRQKNAQTICALVIAAACLFHLAWCCIGGLVLYREIIAPAPVQQTQSVSVPTFALDEEQQRKQERIALLMERALDYEDVGEFIAAFCTSHTQEDIAYYTAIWSNAWHAKYVSDNMDTSYISDSDSAPVEREVSVLGFAGRAGVILALLSAVMTLGNLYYCTRCLLGAKDGWARLIGFCMEHLKVMLVTGDIPAWTAMLCVVIAMTSLNSKLDSERLRLSRRRRIFTAQQAGGLADRDVWLCGQCGYANKKTDSECASCRRYKPLPARRIEVQQKRG